MKPNTVACFDPEFWRAQVVPTMHRGFSVQGHRPADPGGLHCLLWTGFGGPQAGSCHGSCRHWDAWPIDGTAGQSLTLRSMLCCGLADRWMDCRRPLRGPPRLSAENASGRPRTRTTREAARPGTLSVMEGRTMGLLGILLALALLMWLAFRGWSVLLVAPAAALLAAAISGEPLLAHWTQTFMGSASASSRNGFPCSCSAGCSASSWSTAARSTRSRVT